MKKTAFLLVWGILLLHSFVMAEPQQDVDKMLSFPHQKDSLLIRFHEGTTDAVKQMIFDQIGATPYRSFSLVKDSYALKLGTKMDLRTALTTALANVEVMNAEPNYLYSIFKDSNDPRYLSHELWGLEKIGCPASWDTVTDSSVIVAVMDTGVQVDHPDLAANLWVNEAEQNGIEGVDDDGNGYVDDIHGYNFADNTGEMEDEHGHGTHVAGTIGAVGDNGVGVVGVCWKVRIMALRISTAETHEITDEAIFAAIEYACKNGAKVVNMSFGGGAPSAMHQAAIYLSGFQKVLFVAAAGNETNDNDANPVYPASYALDNIISVAASDENDALADFSNFGLTTVDVMAPGVDILSASIEDESGYQEMSGTSMATPHVVGVAALLYQLHPTTTPQYIISQLIHNVDVVPDSKTLSGGRINLQKTIQANWEEQEEEENHKHSNGGCSSFHTTSLSLWDLLPYGLLLLFFVWKRR